jgi:hypothetical protein
MTRYALVLLLVLTACGGTDDPPPITYPTAEGCGVTEMRVTGGSVWVQLVRDSANGACYEPANPAIIGPVVNG